MRVFYLIENQLDFFFTSSYMEEIKGKLATIQSLQAGIKFVAIINISSFRNFF